MFCNNCGAQLPDDAQFCGNCGAQFASGNTYSEPVQEYPAYAQAPVTQEAPAQYYQEQSQYYQQPAQYQEAPAQYQYGANPYERAPQDFSNFAQADFGTTPQPKKKKRKGLIAVLISVVALTLAGVILFFTVIKPNMSPLGKLKKAEMNSLKKMADNATDIYSLALSDNEGFEGSGELKLKLNLGTEILQMLSSLLASEGIDMSLDWLNNIGINSMVNMSDSKGQFKIDIGLGNQSLIDLDVITDVEEEEMYIGVPSLTDKYLCIPLDPNALSGGTSSDDYYDDYYNDYSTPADITSVTEILTDPEFKKALPSAETLNKVIDRYIEICFDNLNDVTKEKETIEVNGISQSLTALKVNISTSTVLNIAESILKEAKTDNDIKNIINNMASYLESKGVIVGADSIYAEFTEGISTALQSLSSAKSMADNTTIATYTCYVDSKNNVKGRAIDAMGQRYLYQATATNSENFATIFEVADRIKFEGSGTEKNGVKNATYSFSINDYTDYLKLVEFQLVDFSNKDDKLNGAIRISPTENLLNEMGLGSGGSSFLSMMDLSLELKFDSTGDKTVMDINLLNAGSVLFGFTTEATSSDKASGPVEIPAQSNIISFEDADQWLSSIDMNKLMDAIKSLPIPEDLLEDLLDSIASSGSSSVTASIG